MSWPYLHTLVNHFPVVLTVVGALAVLLASMFERRAIWIYALATLTLAGLTIYPAAVTGQRAAGAVRNAWYIIPDAIHNHATAAGVTLWVVAVTGALALISLITLLRVREAPSPAKGFRILVGLGALASICAVSYTAYLGGRIVVESPILASPAPPVIAAPAPASGPAAAPTTQQQLPGANPPTTSVQPVTPQPQTSAPRPKTP